MTYFHQVQHMTLSKNILHIEFSYPRKVVLILLDVSVYTVLILC